MTRAAQGVLDPSGAHRVDGGVQPAEVTRWTSGAAASAAGSRPRRARTRPPVPSRVPPNHRVTTATTSLTPAPPGVEDQGARGAEGSPSSLLRWATCGGGPIRNAEQWCRASQCARRAASTTAQAASSVSTVRGGTGTGTVWPRPRPRPDRRGEIGPGRGGGGRPEPEGPAEVAEVIGSPAAVGTSRAARPARAGPSRRPPAPRRWSRSRSRHSRSAASLVSTTALNWMPWKPASASAATTYSPSLVPPRDREPTARP